MAVRWHNSEWSGNRISFRIEKNERKKKFQIDRQQAGNLFLPDLGISQSLIGSKSEPKLGNQRIKAHKVFPAALASLYIPAEQRYRAVIQREDQSGDPRRLPNPERTRSSPSLYTDEIQQLARAGGVGVGRENGLAVLRANCGGVGLAADEDRHFGDDAGMS